MKALAPTICCHLTTLLLLAPAAAAAGSGHDHADIRRAAEQAVEKHMGTPRGRVVAVANEIDSRLRLSSCNVPLEAELPYATTRKTRVTAEVRCPGSRPWKLYVPVRLQVWQQVLIAAGPLTRGKLLEADDMILAERTIGQQTRGFLLDPKHAVGYRLKRSLSEGDVITPAVIVAPPLIERGQAVTIEAAAGGLRVQMAGVALENGLAGDIIKVENRESGRKVEGVVRSGKTVEVLLH
ncbi:MAG: flagellar basal body P-ring formation protein FlgA [Gammaproteobacteria bacterium]|nr:flagellar basal body P-ring formation protein FlgA [Gammaproteobacteria bacterium]